MAIFLKWQNTLPDTTDRFIANLYANISQRWYPTNIIGNKIYDIFSTYAQEFSSGSSEITQTFNDLGIPFARTGVIDDQVTSKMYDNFGTLIGVPRSSLQSFNQFSSSSSLFNSYREELRFLYLASLEGTVPDALKRIGQAFTGMSPVIIEPIHNYNGWILSTYTGTVEAIMTSSDLPNYGYVEVDSAFGRLGTILPVTHIGNITVGSQISLSYSVLGTNTILNSDTFEKSGVLLYYFISNTSGSYAPTIQNLIATQTNALLPAYIIPEIYYSNDYAFWRPQPVPVDAFIAGSNVFANSADGWIYNAAPTTHTGAQYITPSVMIPQNSASFNWFYDWSVIAKNDSNYIVEVRQYNSSSIPQTIPWKIYDPTFPIPLLLPASGNSSFAHWTFAVTTPTSNVFDMSGNDRLFTNNKVSTESFNMWVSRRGFIPILGGGTTGYNMSLSSLVMPTGSFSFEFYLYNLDSTTPNTALTFSKIGGSGGNNVFIDVDAHNQVFQFSLAGGAGNITASIANIMQESGQPPNYHYFAGTFLQGAIGGEMLLYIDGVQVASVSYTGSLTSESGPAFLSGGKELYIDEFSIWTGFLSNRDALARYNATKERLRFLGMTSGSVFPFHQARFTTFASGSNEFELHQFSLCGLQNTSASIFDPRFADLYALPLFSSVSGSSNQVIGQIFY